MPALLTRTMIERAAAACAAGKFAEAQDALAPFAEEGATMEASENGLLFWRDAAVALRDAGLADFARAALGRAVDAGLPGYVARMESALALLIVGRFAEALELLTPLAAERPANAPIRDLHALALFECGRRKEAMTEWDACLGVSAQISCPVCTHPLHLALAAMAMERFFMESKADGGPNESFGGDEPPAGHRAPGRTAAARLRHIERALEQHRFYEALGWMDAEAAAGAAETTDENLGMLRALALGELGRYRDAVALLAGMLENGEPNPPVQSYMGYCLAHAGETELALEILRGVTAMGPDDYFAHFFRGTAHALRHERLPALRELHIAFSDFFFDNYHSVFVPQWQKFVRRVKTEAVCA